MLVVNAALVKCVYTAASSDAAILLPVEVQHHNLYALRLTAVLRTREAGCTNQGAHLGNSHDWTKQHPWQRKSLFFIKRNHNTYLRTRRNPNTNLRAYRNNHSSSIAWVPRAPLHKTHLFICRYQRCSCSGWAGKWPSGGCVS